MGFGSSWGMSMHLAEAMKGITKSENRLAWTVALLADALQLGLFPLFAGGALSPANDVLDFVVAAVLIRALGWHWAFLPSVVAELVPGLDLIPTWTAAVFIATRRSSPGTEPEILPPGPIPNAPR